MLVPLYSTRHIILSKHLQVSVLSMTFGNHIEEIRTLVSQIEQLKTEFQSARRPAEETILDHVALQEMPKVSKRTTAYWRERGVITFSKLGGKIYYRLSDILALISQYEVTAANSKLKIAL